MLKELPKYSPEEMAKANSDVARLSASKRPATVGWVSKNLDGAMETVAKYVHDLRRAVADLEAKTNMLEEKALSYEGVYSKNQQYNPGALVTHRSGLWYCKSATRSAPGTSSDWQLTGKTPLARGAK